MRKYKSNGAIKVESSNVNCVKMLDSFIESYIKQQDAELHFMQENASPLIVVKEFEKEWSNNSTSKIFSNSTQELAKTINQMKSGLMSDFIYKLLVANEWKIEITYDETVEATNDDPFLAFKESGFVTKQYCLCSDENQSNMQFEKMKGNYLKNEYMKDLLSGNKTIISGKTLKNFFNQYIKWENNPSDEEMQKLIMMCHWDILMDGPIAEEARKKEGDFYRCPVEVYDYLVEQAIEFEKGKIHE